MTKIDLHRASLISGSICLDCVTHLHATLIGIFLKIKMLHPENLSYYTPNTTIVAVVDIRLYVKPDFELTQGIFLVASFFSPLYPRVKIVSE